VEAHHIELIRKTIKLAQHNMRQGHGGPFAAIIAKNGIAVASGCNNVTTENDPTAHAEVMAIRNACKKLNTWKLEGYDIYTSCEPCPMCLSATYWAGIDKIWFSAKSEDASLAGFDDDHIYQEMAKPAEQRKIGMSVLLPLEGKALLEEWINMPDKIMY
jgi:guanine deaminase